MKYKVLPIVIFVYASFNLFFFMIIQIILGINCKFISSCYWQVVKLHTKLGKPIPSTEPSMVTQTSTSTTAAPSKPVSAAISSSTSSTASAMNVSSSGSSSSYLKPLGMVNNTAASVMQGKSPASSGISSTAATIKKVNTPKINFVGTCCFAYVVPSLASTLVIYKYLKLV